MQDFTAFSERPQNGDSKPWVSQGAFRPEPGTKTHLGSTAFYLPAAAPCPAPRPFRSPPGRWTQACGHHRLFSRLQRRVPAAGGGRKGAGGRVEGPGHRSPARARSSCPPHPAAPESEGGPGPTPSPARAVWGRTAPPGRRLITATLTHPLRLVPAEVAPEGQKHSGVLGSACVLVGEETEGDAREAAAWWRDVVLAGRSSAAVARPPWSLWAHGRPRTSSSPSPPCSLLATPWAQELGEVPGGLSGRGPHLGLRGALAQGPCHGAVPSVPDGERPPGARLPALCQPVGHGRHGEAGCGLLAPPGSAGRPAGWRALRPGSPGWHLRRGRAPPPCSDPPPCGRLKPTSRRNRNEAARLTELTPAPLRGRPRPSAQHRSAARTPPAGRAGPPRGIPVLGLLSNLHTLCSEH